jgi:predicted ester cyclase
VQDFFRFLFTMIPDVQFERRNVIADGTQAAVEWALQGTVRGQLFPGALSEVPVQLRGASLLWCKRDQIAQVTSYWDWASLEEQVKSPAGKLETRARRNGRRRSRT